MDEKKKSRQSLLQWIAIALLSASSVVLFAQTQLYNLHPGQDYLSSLFPSTPIKTSQSVSALTDLSAPVRIAVTGAYGRYADLSLTTHDDDFGELGTLLKEALGSAGALKSCSADEFRSALGNDTDYGNSIYYDFGENFPLTILSGLVGASWSDSTVSARRVILRADNNTVFLYLWDGGNGYFICSTALIPSVLRQAVERYQLGNAFFALDQKDDYTHLSPFSLFSGQFSPPPDLSVTSTSNDPSALMIALSFNPHTNSRYTESSGTDVVVENDRTLRISPDGRISYQGDSESLSISAAGEVPTTVETVIGVYQLLSSLLSETPNSASLYLQGFQTSGESSILHFGYCAEGLPIRFVDGSPAAEVTVEGTSIVRLNLRLRQYTAGENAGLLLPLAQALSIAKKYSGAELCAYYLDSGNTASVQWLAE